MQLSQLAGFCRVYCCVLIRLAMEKLKDKLRTRFGSRGCLGCGAKAQLITAVDEPFHWHGMWSQRDVSSTSESNPPPPLDPPNSAGGTSNPSEFVNHGKLKSSSLESNEAAVDCSRDATYESLIGTNKPFPQPIPLPEMVDFLVDVWEQEGLYI
ncbi:uncharacterized protein LOC130765620 isoform X3 [Actinidia eriantha]|uniref:uncharacterized protein LOC130765620 isoform X3 n=1 Tax=Actinidia eriantha TaxID=165200 RepID=UPI00258B7B2D|nr:uncharacterized protein LOC130765620 isoform X3 [Actinidia eriantha]